MVMLISGVSASSNFHPGKKYVKKTTVSVFSNLFQLPE